MRFQKMVDFHFVRKCPKKRRRIYESRQPCGFKTIFLSERSFGAKILGQILGQNEEAWKIIQLMYKALYIAGLWRFLRRK